MGQARCRITACCRARAAVNETRWNLLVRQTEQSWVPAGLRPINQISSVLDLFAMTAYPSLLPPERFVIFAADRARRRRWRIRWPAGFCRWMWD